MRALLWKDCRINLLVLVLGGGLLLGPYVAGALYQWYADWPSFPDAATWARILFAGSYFSLSLSQLTLALLGGNTIACERADRSAEFLAYLPPSRAKILASKALLALVLAAVVWGTNLLAAEVLAPALSDASLDVLGLPNRWPLAAVGIVVFGAGWLGSSFLTSPTFATTIGLFAPLLVISVLTLCSLAFNWPAHGEVATWYWPACAVFGVLCFAGGTSYYVRRVEP